MKTITFICNKLARDKTIETMNKHGIITSHKKLTGEEFCVALTQKLLEESTEVLQATNREEIIAELADVCEVINGFKHAYSITSDEIEVVQAKKHQERGGFKNGVFLETVTIPEDNSWVDHFRASSDRYPERS